MTNSLDPIEDAHRFGGRPTTAEQEAAIRAHTAEVLAELPEPPVLLDVIKYPDPREEPDFELDGRPFEVRVEAIRAAECGVDPRPRPARVADMVPPSDVDEFIFDRFIRRNTLAMLAAGYGVGKSNVRKAIEHVAATGCAPLLGRYTVAEPMTVLTVDEDNGEAEEYRRDEAHLAYFGLDRSALDGCYRVSWAALRSREWTTTAMTEIGVVREMARCLREISEGRVPK